jgi:hypothetical protein
MYALRATGIGTAATAERRQGRLWPVRVAEGHLIEFEGFSN